MYAKTRNIKGRVIGTAPIDSITLYKNDEPIWNRNYLIDDRARLATEMVIRLSFRSDATPLNWGDAPRGWRHWRGSLMVEDAGLKAATPTDFINPKTQYLEHEGNTVEFATITRGDESSIELHLTGIGARAEIVLRLEETRETGSAPPFYRRHATIRASELRLALRDMVRGRLERESSIDDYADSVILRRVIRHGAREVAFEYSDSVAPRQGDYYYVRVRQANDAMAWSSPIWVGGYPSR